VDWQVNILLFVRMTNWRELTGRGKRLPFCTLVNAACTNTDTCLLTTGLPSEKCVFWQFRRCANVIRCTYTNPDSIAYCTPRLYGIAYCS